MKGDGQSPIVSYRPENEKGLSPLPKGWELGTIPEFVPLHGVFVDGDWIESKDQDSSGGVRLIQLADIGAGTFLNRSSRFLTTERANMLNCTFLKQNDILVARMPDPIGRACLFPLSKEKSFVTAVDIAIVRFGEWGVSPRYLMHCINSPRSRQKIENLQSGTTRKRISRTNLASIEFPIPPLPEQHRIVAKIEELFSSLDKGIENLKTAQQQLKVYRQAVLKWAFEGRLTNENVVDGELPEGWKWSTMGDIADLRLGKMLDVEKNKGMLKPYLRNSNVRWDSFDLSDLKEMRFTAEEEEKYEVKKGDLVICEGGEPGRAAIWNGPIPNMKIQKALHRVRFDNRMDSRYALYNLMLSADNGHLSEYFTGTTIKHLPGEKLKSYLIPTCSLAEQRAIVSEIESRLSVADKIEEAINNALKQAESLRQSILKKAFEGKLVPQDPNDEPASVLLERIRAERAHGNVHIKSRRKPPRQTPGVAKNATAASTKKEANGR